LALVDEYHAHKDDSVREVLDRRYARDNPCLYYYRRIQLKSACKLAEDSWQRYSLEVNKDNHTLIMIHQMDADDDWEDENNWESKSKHAI
jgi:phage terminase large subunit-like protein